MFPPHNGGILMSHMHMQDAVKPPSHHHMGGAAPHPGARMNNHMDAAADRMRMSARPMNPGGMAPHMPTLPGIGGGGAMLQAMAPRLPTTLSTMGGPGGILGAMRMARP